MVEIELNVCDIRLVHTVDEIEIESHDSISALNSSPCGHQTEMQNEDEYETWISSSPKKTNRRRASRFFLYREIRVEMQQNPIERVKRTVIMNLTTD